MSDSILHFTLGPVQSFVAQARRTRDFWAGSFLLSWLSGKAMAKVIELGGRIDFPAVANGDEITDPLLAAICGKPLAHDPTPQIGSIPNRFRAVVPETLDPQELKQAVLDAWSGLASEVWAEFFAERAGGESKQIWNRQVSAFWDIQWVIGKEVVVDGQQQDGNWLDLRKNWRSQWPDNSEGGDHCTIMGDWQELSGLVRSRDRNAQDEFWASLQQSSKIGRLELRDGERLCAISAIKRLFPKLSESALVDKIGWIPGGNPKAVGSWPSTAYMAALPWLIHLAQDKDGQLHLHDYFAVVQQTLAQKDLAKLASERATSFTALESLRKPACLLEKLSIADMDGNLFIEDALLNARVTPLSDSQANAEFGVDPDLSLIHI